MQLYQHVIWDWNGTLLDDAHLCVDIMNGMLRKRGMPETDSSRYRQIFDFPVRDYYGKLGFDFAGETFESLAAEFCSEYDSRMQECLLHSDGMKMLDALHEVGVAQSLLSSTEQCALTDALRHFSVDRYFSEVVGQADRYATGKIAAGHLMIQRLDIDPGGTVLIGDTLHDHEVATALGIDCVLVCNGHHSRERLEGVHDWVIDSLAELVGGVKTR